MKISEHKKCNTLHHGRNEAFIDKCRQSFFADLQLMLSVALQQGPVHLFDIRDEGLKKCVLNGIICSRCNPPSEACREECILLTRLMQYIVHYCYGLTKCNKIDESLGHLQHQTRHVHLGRGNIQAGSMTAWCLRNVEYFGRENPPLFMAIGKNQPGPSKSIYFLINNAGGNMDRFVGEFEFLFDGNGTIFMSNIELVKIV